MMLVLSLLALGVAVGAIGTLIGLGGGFILIPMLLLCFAASIPDVARPEVITTISLAVIFFNSASGSIAYARMRRVDFKSGLAFAAAGVPGAILGAYAVQYLPRNPFQIAFGSLMLVVAVYLFLRPEKPRSIAAHHAPPGHAQRRIVDASGVEHVYTFNLGVGVLISVGVGFLSSLLGIGGGIIHVPAMVHLMNFPIHLATATSQFVLAIMSLAASVVHLVRGTLQAQIHVIAPLAIGAVGGAQLGAIVSNRLRGRWIVRILAVAIAFVGVRLLTLGLGL